MKKLIAPLIYIAAIVAANVLTNLYGLVPIGFGYVATAGTYAAGVVIVARNVSQDSIGRPKVIALMLIGVGLSWLLSTPTLALASGCAFLLSESADMAIYTPLRKRGRSRAVLIASTIGAVVDTYAFLAIAGFPIAVAAPGQLFGKIAVAVIAATAFRIHRAVTA